MLYRLRERFARFMMGRYGMDELGRFLLYVCLGCVVINILTRNTFVYWFEMIMLVVCYFRMFSRNTYKRYQENEKYKAIKNRILGRVGGNPFAGFGKSRAAQDPTKKIFKCPGCRQKVRVPKGRGTILITCPRCKAQFQKRT